MRWLTKYTPVEPAHAATRMKRVFAYLPTNIAGTMVWLEHYEHLQTYLKKDLLLQVEGKDIKFTVGEWVTASKRVVPRV